MTVSVLWLFLTVPWFGLPCVIVVFPDHTHLITAVFKFTMCNFFPVRFFACVGVVNALKRRLL